MIKHTFTILPRVGKRTEEAFWRQGIVDWHDFLKKKPKGISLAKYQNFRRQILNAAAALSDRDSSYFVDKIASTQVWRLYEEFREETVFLDIESSPNYITVVGLFDGLSTVSFVKGMNLFGANIKRSLEGFKLLVTYNGSSYDLPKLSRQFPGVLPRIPHIDLRHVCNSIGMFGGLKKIEEIRGIKRAYPQKIGGGDPVLLWRTYLASGDDYYLKLLLQYNEEDVISLRHVADFAIAELQKRIKITSYPSPGSGCQSGHQPLRCPVPG